MVLHRFLHTCSQPGPRTVLHWLLNTQRSYTGSSTPVPDRRHGSPSYTSSSTPVPNRVHGRFYTGYSILSENTLVPPHWFPTGSTAAQNRFLHTGSQPGPRRSYTGSSTPVPNLVHGGLTLVPPHTGPQPGSRTVLHWLLNTQRSYTGSSTPVPNRVHGTSTPVPPHRFPTGSMDGFTLVTQYSAIIHWFLHTGFRPGPRQPYTSSSTPVPNLVHGGLIPVPPHRFPTGSTVVLHRFLHNGSQPGSRTVLHWLLNTQRSYTGSSTPVPNRVHGTSTPVPPHRFPTGSMDGFTLVTQYSAIIHWFLHTGFRPGPRQPYTSSSTLVPNRVHGSPTPVPPHRFPTGSTAVLRQFLHTGSQPGPRRSYTGSSTPVPNRVHGRFYTGYSILSDHTLVPPHRFLTGVTAALHQFLHTGSQPGPRRCYTGSSTPVPNRVRGRLTLVHLHWFLTGVTAALHRFLHTGS